MNDTHASCEETLDEHQIATWLSIQIEDGHIPLEDIPKLMARYALAEPDSMRTEIFERMQLGLDEVSPPAGNKDRSLSALYTRWDALTDIEVDGYGAIEKPYLHFPPGTPREDIWLWFESQNPRFNIAEVQNGIRHPESPVGSSTETNNAAPSSGADGDVLKAKTVLGANATKPFYIWANEDCANKSDSFTEAKAIRLALFNEGAQSVHIVDANGVEVVDREIEAHERLVKHEYFAGKRNPDVKPGIPGAFMVNDPLEPDEGYSIVGDDIEALILEAEKHLLLGS